MDPWVHNKVKLGCKNESIQEDESLNIKAWLYIISFVSNWDVIPSTFGTLWTVFPDYTNYLSKHGNNQTEQLDKDYYP